MRSLDGLHIWQKLSLLGVVFALLFAIPTTLFLTQVVRGLAHSSRELAAADRADTALALMLALSEHRALAAGVLGGDASLARSREEARKRTDARFGDLAKGLAANSRPARLLEDHAKTWKGIADAVAGSLMQPSDSHARHSEVIAGVGAALEAVLDDEGLAVDPEMSVHYTAAAAYGHVPALAEALGQAQAHGVLLLASKKGSPEERVGISAVIERVKERGVQVRAAMNKAFVANAGVKAKLAPLILTAEAEVAKALRTARVEVIFSQDLAASPAAHFATQGQAIEAQRKLASAASGQIRELLEARAASEQLQVVVAAVATLLTFFGAVWLAVWTTRSITRPLGHAVRVADGIAAGNLDHDIDAKRAKNAEAARLLKAFSAMQAGLSDMMREIQSVSHEMHRASAQVAEGNIDLSSRTETQASSLEETAATMEELTATVKHNAENAAEATQVVTEASEAAMRGSEAVAGVVATMQSINESSRRIVDIIGVIDGIAFQTNILALNAAVEAARAGEPRTRLRCRRFRGPQPRPPQRRLGQGDQGPGRRFGAGGRLGHQAGPRDGRRHGRHHGLGAARRGDLHRDLRGLARAGQRHRAGQQGGDADGTRHPGKRCARGRGDGRLAISSRAGAAPGRSRGAVPPGGHVIGSLATGVPPRAAAAFADGG